MYEWEIHIILSSGRDIIGRYDGIESDSVSVTKKLVVGQNDNYYISLYDITKTHSLYIRLRDISVIDVYVFEEKGRWEE